MINSNFVILGVIINALGALSYLIGTIQGKTKPNRVTWFLWSLAPLIVFVAQIKEGVGVQSWLAFIIGFTNLLIFLASFINKQAVWKLRSFDYICGTLSLFGLFLWYVTKDGNLAIIFSIIADGLAAVPTLVKSYYFPETEDYKIYLTASISAVIILLTINVWNFANFGFPLYILIICMILLFLIRFRAGKFIQKIFTQKTM